MTNQMFDCVEDKAQLSKHGCFYLKDGMRQCGSPCAQKLIAENLQLKKQIEDLTKRLNEVKGEI